MGCGKYKYQNPIIYLYIYIVFWIASFCKSDLLKMYY